MKQFVPLLYNEMVFQSLYVYQTIILGLLEIGTHTRGESLVRVAMSCSHYVDCPVVPMYLTMVNCSLAILLHNNSRLDFWRKVGVGGCVKIGILMCYNFIFYNSHFLFSKSSQLQMWLYSSKLNYHREEGSWLFFPPFLHMDRRVQLSNFTPSLRYNDSNSLHSNLKTISHLYRDIINCRIFLIYIQLFKFQHSNPKKTKK